MPRKAIGIQKSNVITALNFSRDQEKISIIISTWKKVTDNKHFWKTIKPNFTDKILKDEKIILVVDDKVITAETDLTKIFKDTLKML